MRSRPKYTIRTYGYRYCNAEVIKVVFALDAEKDAQQQENATRS